MFTSQFKPRRTSIASIYSSGDMASGKDLIQQDLEKGAMPIFGIPLLGFSDPVFPG